MKIAPRFCSIAVVLFATALAAPQPTEAASAAHEKVQSVKPSRARFAYEEIQERNRTGQEMPAPSYKRGPKTSHAGLVHVDNRTPYLAVVALDRVYRGTMSGFGDPHLYCIAAAIHINPQAILAKARRLRGDQCMISGPDGGVFVSALSSRHTRS